MKSEEFLEANKRIADKATNQRKQPKIKCQICKLKIDETELEKQRDDGIGSGRIEIDLSTKNKKHK